MSVAERKEREKQQRRTEIIEAAEKRFFEKGFDGVSMDEIARDLELSKPTLYLYFKNKESLFLAVVMRGVVILRDTFVESIGDETTGVGKAKAFARAFFAYARQYPEFYRLLVEASSRRFISVMKSGEVEGAREFGRLSLEMLNLLLDAIRCGQADGTIRKDIDPVETAIFLGMACEGAVHMAPEWEMVLKMNHMSIDRYYEHSIDILLNGIAAETEKK